MHSMDDFAVGRFDRRRRRSSSVERESRSVRKLGDRIRGAFSTLAVIAVLAGSWYLWHHYSRQSLELPDEPATSDAFRSQVILSDSQIAASNIRVATIEPRLSQRLVTVPGRLAYDETRRVSVRLGTDGMLTQVRVKPGDSVKAGDILATMSSPELGTARADQLQCAAALKIAKRRAAWEISQSESVRKLVVAIGERRSLSEIREEFAEQNIGVAREKLLSAYSEQLRAQSLVTRIEIAAESGALPANTVDERNRNADSTKATLQGIIEQTLFDVNLAAQTAESGLNDAQRRWEIATGRVATLLGMSVTPESTAQASGAIASGQDLSSLEIRAPRTATVEQKRFNANERVEAGSELFVLADTSHLWVQADLRESQWTSLALQPGQAISVTSPALPEETLPAKVVMMGREVDPQTNAIALVASIENGSGRLRPGLYVRVELPQGKTSSNIAIPDTAIATHDAASFVFVTTDDHTFSRRDVRLQRSYGGWTEVIAGVAIGERIAVDGVFVLKSELLLEADE